MRMDLSVSIHTMISTYNLIIMNIIKWSTCPKFRNRMNVSLVNVRKSKAISLGMSPTDQLIQFLIIIHFPTRNAAVHIPVALSTDSKVCTFVRLKRCECTVVLSDFCSSFFAALCPKSKTRHYAIINLTGCANGRSGGPKALPGAPRIFRW